MAASCAESAANPEEKKTGKCPPGRVNRGLKPRKLTAADLDPARFLDDDEEADIGQSPEHGAISANAVPENDTDAIVEGASTGAASDALASGAVAEPHALETPEQIAKELAQLPKGAPQKKQLLQKYKDLKAKQDATSAKHSPAPADAGSSKGLPEEPMDLAPEPGIGEIDADELDELDQDFPEDDLPEDADGFTAYAVGWHSKQSAPEKFDTVEAGISAQARESLLSSLSKEQQLYVPVYRWLARLDPGPSLEGRTVLAQLMYWTDPKRAGVHPPRPQYGILGHWTAKSDVDLAAETTLTENVVNKMLKDLKSKGYIAWKVKKFNNLNKRHIWVRWENLLAAYGEPVQDAK